MSGEHQIKPLGRQKMDGWPARQRDQETHHATDEQEDHGGDRMRLDQRLRRDIDLETGILASAEFGGLADCPDDGFGGHDVTSPRRGVDQPRLVSGP